MGHDLQFLVETKKVLNPLAIHNVSKTHLYCITQLIKSAHTYYVKKKSFSLTFDLEIKDTFVKT